MAGATSAEDALARLAGAYTRVVLDCLDLINVVFFELHGDFDHQGSWPPPAW